MQKIILQKIKDFVKNLWFGYTSLSISLFPWQQESIFLIDFNSICWEAFLPGRITLLIPWPLLYLTLGWRTALKKKRLSIITCCVIFKSSTSTYDSEIWERVLFGNVRSSHCVKSVQIWSHFWSEYRKKRTRNNSVFPYNFHAVPYIRNKKYFSLYRYFRNQFLLLMRCSNLGNGESRMDIPFNCINAFMEAAVPKFSWKICYKHSKSLKIK